MNARAFDVSKFSAMESVKLIECPRDAWQGLKGQIPTARKVQYLRALVGAGFRRIDAVSFVSPKIVPQMADSEEVLAQLGRLNNTEIIGIVVNEKGAERAIATGAVSTLGYPCSISETFLRRNQRQSMAENRAVMQNIKRRADEARLAMVVYISMGFGNPYGEPWSEGKVAEAAAGIARLGVSAVSIADTVGTATPEQIRRVMSAVSLEHNGTEIGIHLHSTRTDAAGKILAAYDAGCRRFDAAMGGLGGCPFAQDELVGNVPTEELLRALRQRGAKLPFENDLSTLAKMNAAIDAEFSA